MAIKNWFIRGDTHGDFTWLTSEELPKCEPEETAFLILGDAGLDFYLNKTDERKKKEINAKGYYIYFLRGNHEQRPSLVDGYEAIFDAEVKGTVYCDPRFPHIRAFLDYGFYQIKNYTCLIIGGAYSVDKYFRLERFGLTDATNIPKKTGWFNGEQLTPEEMNDCLEKVKLFAATGKTVDFVFTHTCPLSYQPKDMFLSFIDQSKVDNSMEKFLEEIKEIIPWNIWCFGHYHADRLERPHVEQYYNHIKNIDDIWNCWQHYDETGEIDCWWIPKSPFFYS